MAFGKTTRKYVINAAIIVFVALLTCFYLFRNKNVTIESVRAVKWYYFLICFCLFFACVLIEATIERLVYGTFTDEMNYGKSLLNVLFGRFGSGITPFRSGHFPLKAYYQYKAGIAAQTTVTGFLKCQIIYSAVAIIVYFAVFIYLLVTGISAEVAGVNVKLWTAAAIGLAFHVVVFAAVIVLAFSERFQRGTLNLFCKVAKKVKKTFDGEKFYTEQTEKLARFKEQVKIVGKSFEKYLLPAALYALYMVLSGSFQYAAFLLLSGKTFTAAGLFMFYILNLTSTYIANVVPLPGGVGTAEVLFLLVSANVISDPLLGETLVLWRVSTYYVPIIAEFLLFLPISINKRKMQNFS